MFSNFHIFNLHYLLFFISAVFHSRHCETPLTNPLEIMFVFTFSKQRIWFWKFLELFFCPYSGDLGGGWDGKSSLRYLPLKDRPAMRECCTEDEANDKKILQNICEQLQVEQKRL